MPGPLVICDEVLESTLWIVKANVTLVYNNSLVALTCNDINYIYVYKNHENVTSIWKIVLACCRYFEHRQTYLEEYLENISTQTIEQSEVLLL